MKRSTRLIRNTILALGGLIVVYTLASRLFVVHGPAREEKRGTSTTELAKLRDFNSVQVSGDVSVEIVQQTDYSVDVSPAASQKLVTAIVRDNTLEVRGYGNAHASRVRVGMPALAHLEAEGNPVLSVSGFSGGSVEMRLGEVSQVSLRNNAVDKWQVYASDDVELQFDRASIGAGKVELSGSATLAVVE
jgi:hypothetical protein